MTQIQPIFLLLALLAEILGTVGGFGSSVFFVPIGNFYFDFYSVLGLTALFHLSSNMSKIMLFKKGFDRQMLFRLGGPAVLLVIVGGWASRYFDTHILQGVLGLFLVAFSLLFLIKKELVLKASAKNAIIGGSLSGFSAGLLGTGGAIRGLTMAAFNLEKNVFIVTSAMIDMMIDVSRSFVYWQNGYINKDLLFYVPILFVIGLVGSWLGKRILVFIPQTKFRQLSLVLILAIGVITLGAWIGVFA
ncbi:sulfite exporter TauE/SafE family protein [Flavobacteriaceae bacterium]|nr:sulfite exporter TauE/SafE family protein [Flavobacteriaceae bacterium]